VSRRYRITVDQNAIERARPALHVHDRESGTRRNYGGTLVLAGAILAQGPIQQDGARVWIECDTFHEAP
jgi:hypothetical protein